MASAKRAMPIVTKRRSGVLKAAGAAKWLVTVDINGSFTRMCVKVEQIRQCVAAVLGRGIYGQSCTPSC
jgi:hypothetical protein